MKVCISCSANVEGKTAVRIKEDRVIRTIRLIKKTLGVAANNELFVCVGCIPKQTDRRKAFEKSMLFASILSGLILVILVIAIVLSGRLDPLSLISTFIVSGFILVLPLFKYAPAMENPIASKMPMLNSPPTPPSPPLPQDIEVQIKPAPKSKSKKTKSK